jgi:hypothetical protein
MKHIVLDCLRRWTWLYSVGFVLAAGIDVIALSNPSFSALTPYFLAPMLGPLFVLGFDLMRGTAGLAVALPVSARKVGVGYWIVGVSVPPVLFSLALVVAGIIVHLFIVPIPSLGEQVASTFVISFLICGCVFFVLTVFKVGPQEGLWNNVAGGLAGACWGVSSFAGIGVKYLLDFRGHDVVMITIVACAALVFTVLGFLRCEEVVRSRARIRLAQRVAPRRSGTTVLMTESTKSGITGFPYMFLESIKFSLGMAFGLMLFGFVLRTFIPINSPFIQYTLLACALLPSLRYFVGLRQLRALPFSLDGLAAILFFLPLVNFSLCLAVLAIVEAITATGTFNAPPATLWFTAAITSVGNAMLVRFGPKSLPIAFAIGIMCLFAIPTKLLLASYAVGAAVLIAAFVILRSALRSSNLYRLPAGTVAAC